MSLRGKNLLSNWDFLFKLEINKVYTYLINANFNFISIRNNSVTPLIIPRYYRIGFVIKYEAKEGYLI